MNVNGNGFLMPQQQPNSALSGTKRLSRQQGGFQRPETTVTDSINQDEAQIKLKLENYVEVKDIEMISVNTHVRYMVFDTRVGKYMFRLGGLLAMKHATYVVLSNGKQTWSVPKESEFNKQMYPTRFFRVLNPYEMKQKQFETQSKEKDEATMIAQQQHEELESQKAEIDKLKRVIAKLSGGSNSSGAKGGRYNWCNDVNWFKILLLLFIFTVVIFDFIHKIEK